MRKSLASILLFFALALTLQAADTVVEEIVARVNNSIITRTDLARSKEQMTNEAHQKNVPQDEIDKRQSDILRDLIDQQLLVQKAADLGITGDNELIKRLDEIRKSMNLNSMEELEQEAEKSGVSYEDFKQNLRNSILTQSVIGREVGSHIQITPEEVQKFYEEHQKELERPEQVALSEILIAPVKPAPNAKEGDPLPDPTPEQLAAAEQKAQQALDEIKKGTKFEDVAKKYSDGPTASQGGALGEFGRGMLAKELEEKTFAMKPGEVTDPIRTRQGFVLLKVIDHTQPGIPPLKQVEPNIQEAIYLRKLQPALREYLTKLREDAYIDIKPGFVDTGASPNQKNPIMVAQDSKSGDEQGEKKKKKRFLLF
ncbi:MAG TPA: peptidylprolyl isomerase [Terriglobales bacterium]|nr:peptidylprolyl isomerase [Terriglobales bacterium]